MCPTSGVRPAQDIFAAIGAQREAAGKAALVEPQPPVLPRKVLALAPAKPGPRLKTEPKIDTPDKLARELARQRHRHARFLQNHAPAPPSTRDLIPVPCFDWRIARPEDWQDFPGVLAGAGPWERVSIPHYGEPVGLASTFYRTAVTLTAAQIEQRAVFVAFKGVDYIAHVFVNGSLIGRHEGMFAPFDFDATAAVRPGENVLFVRVDNDYPTVGGSNHKDHRNLDGDKIYAATGPGYNEPESGWHHSPPAMGIYQSVRVETRTAAAVFQ